MPIVKIVSHLVNTDNIAHVATDVIARPPGKPIVTDAVRIYFLSGDPLTLFGDEAAEALAVLSPPTPAPVKVEVVTKAEAAKPAPAAVVTPTPAPAKP